MPFLRKRRDANTVQDQTRAGIKHGAESNAENQLRLNHKGTKDTKQKPAKFPAIGIADRNRRRFLISW
jgi:hypothetical protein